MPPRLATPRTAATKAELAAARTTARTANVAVPAANASARRAPIRNARARERSERLGAFSRRGTVIAATSAFVDMATSVPWVTSSRIGRGPRLTP
jgi:hypothetical protein